MGFHRSGVFRGGGTCGAGESWVSEAEREAKAASERTGGGGSKGEMGRKGLRVVEKSEGRSGRVISLALGNAITAALLSIL